MNINALRGKYKVQQATSFSATLHWTNSTDDDISITGAQEGIYTRSDTINYGPVADNPSRTVILLPCLQVVAANGVSVEVVPDQQITNQSTSETFIVNAADKTLKGTWWRCIVSKEGR